MVNIWGVVSIVVFYLLILAVGIWAGRKRKDSPEKNSEDEIILGGRNLGMFVGIFTMTATWVGGGYINGTAEAIYNNGLLWCQAPFGNAIALIIGGFFFASKMRQRGYVTMLDPFQEVFGSKMGGMLFIPAFLADIFWASSVLFSLGSTLSVIIEMDRVTSIILSACVAAMYTLFGGLKSVAYTDVIQLFCIFIGLWLCIPFALTSAPIGNISEAIWEKELDFIGTVKKEDVGIWLDYAMVLIFGGLPWQVYFQRVLSCKTARSAQTLSYVAALGCFFMAIPSILVGGIAKMADWNQTEYGQLYGNDPSSMGDSSMILPLVMRHLTPEAVSIFGLGAVSAAVMSSADSSVLSASSMFARNIYRLIFRPKASETEILWVMRLSIFFVTALSVTIALTVSTVYGLWITYSDLVYVVLFPQLLMSVHFPSYCNAYGSLAAYLVAILLRLGGGEELIKLKAFIHYPYFQEGDDAQAIWERQRFPFRTFTMLISLITLPCVSRLTMWIDKRRKSSSESAGGGGGGSKNGGKSLVVDRDLDVDVTRSKEKEAVATISTADVVAVMATMTPSITTSTPRANLQEES